MQNKLYQTIKNYAQSNPIRFHMPSHNGENLGITTQMDVTELSFSDNLIESDGVIANTEKNIAKAYNSKYALMLTNGATCGVAIALYTAKNYGSKLLIVGDAHKSVYNYANIFNFEIFATQTTNNINPNDYDCIVITSPNYFGNVTDINNLKNTTAIVIVDASHGSHFPFNDNLPDLNTKIADITILSFHKTLPILTGGAGIITNDAKLYDMLVFARSLLHSSSPSYLTMTSIDNAICEFYNNGQTLYDTCINEIENFKKTMCSRYTVLESDDITRLCICAKNLDASIIAKELEKKNIFIEMSYYDSLVAIVTPYNCKHLQTLAKALNSIVTYKKCERFDIKNLSKIEVKNKKVAFLDLKICDNKVCAGNIGIYPPGTPILKIGDLITEDIIQFLYTTKAEIFGLVNGKVPVYEQ